MTPERREQVREAVEAACAAHRLTKSPNVPMPMPTPDELAELFRDAAHGAAWRMEAEVWREYNVLRTGCASCGGQLLEDDEVPRCEDCQPTEDQDAYWHDNMADIQEEIAMRVKDTDALTRGEGGGG